MALLARNSRALCDAIKSTKVENSLFFTKVNTDNVRSFSFCFEEGLMDAGSSGKTRNESSWAGRSQLLSTQSRVDISGFVSGGK